jgi:hypothetical protein
VANSSHAPGQGEQAPYLILQDCPLLEVQRQQTWPKDLDTHTKLWRTEADLRATDQTVPGDLDTHTKLWGTEAGLRATAQF